METSAMCISRKTTLLDGADEQTFASFTGVRIKTIPRRAAKLPLF